MWKRELWKNKIFALMFMVLGVLAAVVDYDVTLLVLCVPVAVMLFFSKKNWIM